MSNPQQNNGAQPVLNWKDSIQTNIHFFREQSKLLEDAYNPSQIASGALMTVVIMNHNLLMGQVGVIHQRLDRIEKLLTMFSPRDPESYSD